MLSAACSSGAAAAVCDAAEAQQAGGYSVPLAHHEQRLSVFDTAEAEEATATPRRSHRQGSRSRRVCGALYSTAWAVSDCSPLIDVRVCRSLLCGSRKGLLWLRVGSWRD